MTKLHRNDLVGQVNLGAREYGISTVPWLQKYPDFHCKTLD